MNVLQNKCSLKKKKKVLERTRLEYERRIAGKFKEKCRLGGIYVCISDEVWKIHEETNKQNKQTIKTPEFNKPHQTT